MCIGWTKHHLISFFLEFLYCFTPTVVINSGIRALSSSHLPTLLSAALCWDNKPADQCSLSIVVWYWRQTVRGTRIVSLGGGTLITHLPGAPGFRKCSDVSGRGVWRNGSGIPHKKNPARLDWRLARVHLCPRSHSSVSFKSQPHTRDSTDLSVTVLFLLIISSPRCRVFCLIRRYLLTSKISACRRNIGLKSLMTAGCRCGSSSPLEITLKEITQLKSTRSR